MPSDWHLVHLGSRAVGGAGLVMTEMTDVSRDGRISPGCAGMYMPEHVVAWQRIVEFVHGESSARRSACSSRTPAARARPASSGKAGRAARRRATGRCRGLADSLPARQPGAARDGPRATWTACGRLRARRRDGRGRRVRPPRAPRRPRLPAGVVHLAADQPPHATSTAGRSAQRLRFPLEVFVAVRAAWPAAKPISVRISATDWKPGGLEPPRSRRVARALRAARLPTSSTSRPGRRCRSSSRCTAGSVPDTVQRPDPPRGPGMPTMTVGAIASTADVNTILAAGRADLCRAGPRPSLGSLLDAPCSGRPGISDAVAGGVRHAQSV